MTFPGQRSLKKMTAAVVVSWLFALSASTLLACDMKDDVRNALVPVSVGQDQQHHQVCDGPPGCKQFCANDLPVVSTVDRGHDQDRAPAATMAAPALANPGVAEAAPALALAVRSGPPPGPSIYIRFVRLAL